MRTTAVREERLAAIVRGESAQPYDLENGPLLRLLLVRLTADEYVFAIGMHHIVAADFMAERRPQHRMIAIGRRQADHADRHADLLLHQVRPPFLYL